MTKLCADLIDDKTLAAMNLNDGFGPKSQDVCTTMANRLDEWMVANPNGYRIDDAYLRVDRYGMFVPEEELARNPNLETDSAYFVSPGRLREWVQFLQHCGGFRVW